MVAEGKGILAADESAVTCKKRFDSVNVECTEDNRRAYRQTLFTAVGLEAYISGVILHDETIRQKGADGKRLAEILSEKGILPGIKVDGGLKNLALHGEEKNHRRSRRPARTTCRIQNARRKIRQVARSHHYRREYTVGSVRERQCARARPLRGAVSGGGYRADDRAGGLDRGRPHARRVLRGHRDRPRRSV